jgi:uncharacterized phage-like protein YoqJ
MRIGKGQNQKSFYRNFFDHQIQFERKRSFRSACGRARPTKKEGFLMKSNSACFTGHRPMFFDFGHNERDPRCLRIKERMRAAVIDLIDNHGITHFLSGMADGVDRWAADIILDLKSAYPDITLECAIPYILQYNEWTEWNRPHYHEIIKQCDKTTYLQENYSDDCFIKRDHYMVDQSSYVIAIWSGVPSGTGDTVAYADECGTPVIYINME